MPHLEEISGINLTSSILAIMPFGAILIDLDDTIYPSSSGIWTLIGQRIGVYMHEKVGIDSELVPFLRRELFLKYGTTMRGLKVLYDIDESDYLRFVHDVPIEQILSPNPNLRETLERIPIKKYIFTNADSQHANRVLNALDIQNCFTDIIDIIKISPFCKPQKEAFSQALDLINEQLPQNCIFIDDSFHNTKIAKELGFFTIYIGQETDSTKFDARIGQLKDLDKILPTLMIK